LKKLLSGQTAFGLAQHIKRKELAIGRSLVLPDQQSGTGPKRELLAAGQSLAKCCERDGPRGCLEHLRVGLRQLDEQGALKVSARGQLGLGLGQQASHHGRRHFGWPRGGL
jgi:hypothetical protein